MPQDLPPAQRATPQAAAACGLNSTRCVTGWTASAAPGGDITRRSGTPGAQADAAPKNHTDGVTRIILSAARLTAWLTSAVRPHRGGRVDGRGMLAADENVPVLLLLADPGEADGLVSGLEGIDGRA
jgi:hypothetical protein